jgi:hypothetical protein
VLWLLRTCALVTSLRCLFAPSQFLSIVTQRQSVASTRPQNVSLNENGVGSSEVATPIMGRVRMPGSRIVTGSALHPHKISAGEARFWRIVDAPVSTDHGCAFMWRFDDFSGVQHHALQRR